MAHPGHSAVRNGLIPVTCSFMKRAAGWTLIGIAAWFGLGVLFAAGSIVSGNTGRPGTEVSTGTALLAAATLAVFAWTLIRVGLRLLKSDE